MSTNAESDKPSVTSARQLFEQGIITVNELRARIGMDPLPAGSFPAKPNPVREFLIAFVFPIVLLCGGGTLAGVFHIYQRVVAIETGKTPLPVAPFAKCACGQNCQCERVATGAPL